MWRVFTIKLQAELKILRVFHQHNMEDGQWDIIITSLQDVCNTNESTLFNNKYKAMLNENDLPDKQELSELLDEIQEHQATVQTSQRLIETCQQNLQSLIVTVQKQQASATRASRNSISKDSGAAGVPGSKKQKKVGRLYYVSKHNPSEPIVIGSEVAYKLKNRHTEEWIQCEVTKILGDGVKFEVRDPEPDENNNPGQTFKANYKEIILIATASLLKSYPNYPYGSKVLARYPETTTFYPAVVVGTKKDTKVRLKFDGEEEANKETEVERRLVLPYPEK